MSITLRYFEGCPNWEIALERIRRAQGLVGGDEPAVELELVASEEEAERLQFPGSPTILVGGRDPFLEDERAPFGLTCRVYRTERGLEGSPSVEQLRAVLEEEVDPAR